MGQIIDLGAARDRQRLTRDLNAVEEVFNTRQHPPIEFSVGLTALMRAGATAEEMISFLNSFDDPIAWAAMPREFA